MSELGHYLDWPRVITADLLTLVCGEKLGSGIAREVYVFALDPTKVLKFEYANHSFQNAREWYVWKDLQDAPDWNKWLAPCHFISSCGHVLLQTRTKSLTDTDIFPKTLPKFLTDTKRTNYGRINNRIVCHDYGTCVAEYNRAVRKAQWWT